MKKICLLAVLFVCNLQAFGREWKTIRFGVDPSYAPFESKAPDGQLIGFDIDLGNAICSVVGAKAIWVENDFDGMIPALKARRIDGVLSTLAITEKRRSQILFTDSYVKSPTRMVAKSGSGLLPDAGSLKGKNVGVEQGTTQEAFARAEWEPQGVRVVAYQNQDLVYEDLRTGRLDASLQDAIQASAGFLQNPQGQGFAFCGPVLDDPKFFGEGIGIGLRKEDTELRDLLNRAINQLKTNGTFDELIKKYPVLSSRS